MTTSLISSTETARAAIDTDWLTFEYGCRHTGAPTPDSEPEEYTIRWTVDAMDYLDEEDDEKQVRVGRAQFSVIHNPTEIDLLDTLDAIDHESMSLAEMLTNDRPDLLDDMSEIQLGGDIIFVETVEVFPDYRGHKVGHAMVNAFLKTVARNAGLVVLRAAPVLTDRGPEEGTPEHSAEKAALREYWISMGFKEASGDYLYLPMGMDAE